MIICLPFHSGDAQLLSQLLHWIAKFGFNGSHAALLVADGAVDYAVAEGLMRDARKAFGRVNMKATIPTQGWIRGSNVLFECAATSLAGQAFLFVEPDATPTRPGWIEEIEAEYMRCEKPFMGALVNHQTPKLPSPYLEGCAVYPSNAWELMRAGFNHAQSWTLACAELVVPLTHHSELFQHRWGEREKAPTFIAEKTEYSAINALTLSELNPKTALYHRCKDGSLMRLLERKLFPADSHRNITVVFPICNMDFQLALHHARWLLKMETRWNHDAVIAVDGSVPSHLIKQFQEMLTQCFRSTDLFRYPTPHGGYPAVANAAWRNVALEMQRRGKPWFWNEADGVALRPDWVAQFQNEYDLCGKDWMGVVVPHMGHLQGTAIYPFDAANRMPRAMNAPPHQAFDMEGKSETAHSQHDASHLLQHCWTIVNDEPCPVGGGHLPSSATLEQARRWIKPGAVFWHRFKGRDLVDHLLSGQLKV